MDKVKLRGLVIIIIITFITVSICSLNEEHYLGRGFTYYEYPSSIAYWRKGDTLSFDIPPDIIKYNNTSSHLLVKHRPRLYGHSDFTSFVYPNGRDTIYYFYIDKKIKEITGPLLYSEMEVYLKEKNLEQMLYKLE